MEPFSIQTDFREDAYVRGLKQYWWHSWKAQQRRSGLSVVLVTFVIVAGVITATLEARGLTPVVNWRFAFISMSATVLIYFGTALNRRWRYLQGHIIGNRKFSHEENSGLLVLDDVWFSHRFIHYRVDNAWHACQSWRLESDILTIVWISGHIAIVPVEFVGPKAFMRIVEIVRTYAPESAAQ